MRRARGRERLPRRLHRLCIFLCCRLACVAFFRLFREICGQLFFLACKRVEFFLRGRERPFALRLAGAAELDVLFEHGDGLLLLRQ